MEEFLDGKEFPPFVVTPEMITPEVIEEAHYRRMEPVEYLQEVEMCRLADIRMAEIMRKKADNPPPVETITEDTEIL
jgi:hypothetical protein